jgi:hypothetical protein
MALLQALLRHPPELCCSRFSSLRPEPASTGKIPQIQPLTQIATNARWPLVILQAPAPASHFISQPCASNLRSTPFANPGHSGKQPRESSGEARHRNDPSSDDQPLKPATQAESCGLSYAAGSKRCIIIEACRPVSNGIADPQPSDNAV